MFISPEHPYTLRINTLLLKTETNQNHTYGLKTIREYKNIKLYEDKGSNNKNCVSAWSIIKKEWNLHKKF